MNTSKITEILTTKAQTLSEFLFIKIKESIEYKAYIAAINISFVYAESFGDEYITVYYKVVGNTLFDELDQDIKDNLLLRLNYFRFPIFNNNPKKNYEEQHDDRKYLPRILEFKHLYEGLSQYVILQLESSLNPATTINIQQIDAWPHANYAEKYVLTSIKDNYPNIMQSLFNADANQITELQQLAEQSQKIYKKEKKQFNITDTEINTLTGLKLYFIRNLAFRNDVPIKITGTNTVDEIHMHAGKLAEALAIEIQDGWEYDRPTFEKILNYVNELKIS